ncbi:hypothetical protein DDE05_51620 [Streptomyces cavourensis]|nr:hypothetical protein DDE05_51620 [Streptomyces cavourensis]
MPARECRRQRAGPGHSRSPLLPADADSSRNPANAVPTHKHDLLGAEIIVASGYPAVHAQLPALLVWMQDINWPVARVLAPFLASIGAPLADHVRTILASDDPIWTYNVLAYLVSASAPPRPGGGTAVDAPGGAAQPGRARRRRRRTRRPDPGDAARKPLKAPRQNRPPSSRKCKRSKHFEATRRRPGLPRATCRTLAAIPSPYEAPPLFPNLARWEPRQRRSAGQNGVRTGC